jgi:hypothetical protein
MDRSRDLGKGKYSYQVDLHFTLDYYIVSVLFLLAFVCGEGVKIVSVTGVGLKQRVGGDDCIPCSVRVCVGGADRIWRQRSIMHADANACTTTKRAIKHGPVLRMRPETCTYLRDPISLVAARHLVVRMVPAAASSAPSPPAAATAAAIAAPMSLISQQQKKNHKL